MKTFSSAVIAGFFGATAVTLSFSLQWHTWVLFIAWVSYYIFGKSLQSSLLPFVQIGLGILLGLFIQASGRELSSLVGSWGLPVAVFFFIGLLMYICTLTKLNNIPAWFLGLIIFFGAHPPVEFVPVASLLLPVISGFLFAWLNDIAIHKTTLIKTTH